MIRTNFLPFALLAVVSSTSGALAQTPNEAQSAFADAQQALADGRLTTARDLYRRSLALEPRVPTAFNLAAVLPSHR